MAAGASACQSPTGNMATGVIQEARKYVSRYTAKLEAFDGTTEPLETFLARFEHFSRHYQWDEEERMFHLQNSLVKDVGNLQWDSKKADTSEELINVLWGRYGNTGQVDRFRSE